MALVTMATALAGSLEIDSNGSDLIHTLKNTVFKGQDNKAPTDEQLMALMIVAKQYRLNPWTKEIYAFPAKGGGIVPIVGLDGWLNIINNHPQFDGMEFEYSMEGADKKQWSVTCIIHRKDRSKPVKVTEFYDECYRNTEPWNMMARRMLRNKSIIQCGRVAFGYGGIHDHDEAEDIVKNMGPVQEVDRDTGEIKRAAAVAEAATNFFPQQKFDAQFETYVAPIKKGKKSVDDVIAWLESGPHQLSDEQKKRLREVKVAQDVTPKEQPAAEQQPAQTSGSGASEADAFTAPTYPEVAQKIARAKNADELNLAGDLIQHVQCGPEMKAELQQKFDAREQELKA